MLRRCVEADRQSLNSFLSRNEVCNTFMLADIHSFGFDKPYQRVYRQLSDTGTTVAVALVFHNNLLLAGDPAKMEVGAIAALVDKEIDTIMGPADLVRTLATHSSLTDQYPEATFSQRDLFRLTSSEFLLPVSGATRTATEGDVDAIHSFLMRIPQFQTIYADKEMIRTRIRENTGTHLLLEQGGVILAHANTAAQANSTVMVGGLGVDESSRGRGLARQVLSDLSTAMLQQGLAPCLFSDYPQDHSLYSPLGFRKVDDWGVLDLNRRRSNDSKTDPTPGN